MLFIRYLGYRGERFASTLKEFGSSSPEDAVRRVRADEANVNLLTKSDQIFGPRQKKLLLTGSSADWHIGVYFISFTS